MERDKTRRARTLSKILTGIRPGDRQVALCRAYLKSREIPGTTGRLRAGEEIPKKAGEELDRWMREEGESLEVLVEAFEGMEEKDKRRQLGISYTPRSLREYILDLAFEGMDRPLVADPSCGCGAFLLSAARRLCREGESLSDVLSRMVYGIDKNPEAIREAALLFDLLCLEAGEEPPKRYPHLICTDATDPRASQCLLTLSGGGFDLVVGNPPYVTAAHLEEETGRNLSHWQTTRSGRKDLYLVFYEIGLGLLKEGGRLVYVSPNTFLHSRNGRELRSLLKGSRRNLKVVDFGDRQIFEDICSYTCVLQVYGKRTIEPWLYYARLLGKGAFPDRAQLEGLSFLGSPLSSFAPGQPWRVLGEETGEIIEKLEQVPGGKRLDSWPIHSGIITLKDEVFIFSPTETRGDTFERRYGGKVYHLEKESCRDIVKNNILRREEDLTGKRKKIIYPYEEMREGERGRRMPLCLEEKQLAERFPGTYAFLRAAKEELLSRDKGKGRYPRWYAYGRRQGFGARGRKILLPQYQREATAVRCLEPGLLFYAGTAICEEDEEVLWTLQRFLRSSAFWFYLWHTSRPYANGYRSAEKTFIRAFQIPDLTGAQRRELLSLPEGGDSEAWIWERYGIRQPPAPIG